MSTTAGRLIIGCKDLTTMLPYGEQRLIDKRIMVPIWLCLAKIRFRLKQLYARSHVGTAWFASSSSRFAR